MPTFVGRRCRKGFSYRDLRRYIEERTGMRYRHERVLALGRRAGVFVPEPGQRFPKPGFYQMPPEDYRKLIAAFWQERGEIESRRARRALSRLEQRNRDTANRDASPAEQDSSATEG